MKKFLATMLALVMALTLCATAWADEPTSVFDESNMATVTDVASLKAAFDEFNGKPNGGTYTISIANDITFDDTTWNNNIGGGKTLIIEGNDHSLFNMHGMLIWNTNGDFVTVKNLTIDGATVPVATDEMGASGAFIGDADNTDTLTFINCAVKNSTIAGAGAKRAGAFVGYASKASDAKTTVGITFKGCTVSNCTISAENVGGLMGHAMASSNMAVTVGETNVKDNTITGTDKVEKVGALFGTVGTGESDSKASIAATVSGNTVKCKGTTLEGAVYGRQVNDGTTLTLTGGSYDEQPLKGDDSAWAKVAADVTGAKVTTADGKTTYIYDKDTINDLAKRGGTKIQMLQGSVVVNGVEINAGSGEVIVPQKYTVTFDSDGGNTVESQTVTENGKVNKPADPTKDGYVFEHWCLSTDDTHTAYDFNAPVKSDITLKAHWTAQSSGGTHHIYRPQPTTDTTETKAESPKTFDAGVAVYGLMAVSSVLGMGYIGKKKF